MKSFLNDEEYKKILLRAQRRKSAWNLLLLFFNIIFIGIVTYGLFQIMWYVHVAIYPAHAGRFNEYWGEGLGPAAFISSFLLLFPLLAAAFPIGFLLTNCTLWFIPSVRKVFEEEAKDVEETFGEKVSFSESMKDLLKLIGIVVPVCLLLSLIGAITLSDFR